MYITAEAVDTALFINAMIFVSACLLGMNPEGMAEKEHLSRFLGSIFFCLCSVFCVARCCRAGRSGDSVSAAASSVQRLYRC